MKREIIGTIIGGYGFATKIMEDKLSEYHKQLNGSIIPGTLNLKLDEDFIMPEGCIVIDWGSQKFFYYQIEVFGKPAYIMRPERNPFSNNIVEIIGTEHICSSHGLNYGDKASFVIELAE